MSKDNNMIDNVEILENLNENNIVYVGKMVAGRVDASKYEDTCDCLIIKK